MSHNSSLKRPPAEDGSLEDNGTDMVVLKPVKRQRREGQEEDPDSNDTPVFPFIPSEILLEIFTCLGRLRSGTPRGSIAFLDLLLVCRRWRNAALSCHDLWTDIPVFSEKWTKKMLDWSKDVPLSVNVHTNLATDNHSPTDIPRANSAALSETLVHFPRVQELQIKNFLPGEIGTFINSGLASAPLLESLQLIVARKELTAPDGRRQVVALFTPPSVQAPRLQRFTLVHMGFSWNLSMLRNLVELEVRDPAEQSRASMSTVLDTLREMLFLERLSLHNALWDNGQVTASTSPVDLPRMKRLELSGPGRELELVLGALILRRDVRMKLNLNGALFSGAIMKLRKHYPEPSLGSPPGCYLNKLNMTDGNFRTGFSVRAWTNIDKENDPQIELLLSWSHGEYSYQAARGVATTLSVALPLREVEEIVALNLPMSDKDWKRAFGSFKKLVKVKRVEKKWDPSQLVDRRFNSAPFFSPKVAVGVGPR
ncbi:unnamed protein product [Cyclocybe aegerita]|uniref:F-box domain-containing protein n=1 Tax=Cyclocybe aegerita TaxID=1973307 RepID=A0A8S0WWN7_CYCAE|nr:unnamed protein product [Cyclocybe aegerita]